MTTLTAPTVPRFSLFTADVPLPGLAGHPDLTIRYDVDRCLQLPDVYFAVVGDTPRRDREVFRGMQAARVTFDAEWPEARRIPDDLDWVDARETLGATLGTARLERARLLRELNLRIIAFTVLTVLGLTDTDPWVDPTDPSTWTEWGDNVLTWIAGEGIEVAKAQMRDPEPDPNAGRRPAPAIGSGTTSTSAATPGPEAVSELS